ncbi:MAG: sugar phosphate isomerase/epimerase family protein [Endomicrobiales bacterium]
MLSISTAYHIGKFRSWPKLLRETGKLGFDTLELNVEVPGAWMGEIERSVTAGEVSISSLHNYCPRLESLPEGRTIYSGYLMTSDDEEERKLSVSCTRSTIEWAARLKARAVVVHAGEVKTEPSGREFVRYVQQFGRSGKLYRQYEEAVQRDRKKKSPLYLERLMKTLDELLPFAQEKGVTLGLENRFYYHEIPDIEETKELLVRYRGAPLGYWHDTGHAELFVRQGWVKSHEDYLKAFHPRIVGMHLHDLRSFSDHFAPGSGDFDFSVLKPYIAENTLLVVEAHAKATAREVQCGIEYLKKTIIS